MTVHKSQGSEYDTVASDPPTETSPLVGRELLYTAVTRAPCRLVIVGDDAAVRRAVLTPARRVTGLVDALDTSLTHHPPTDGRKHDRTVLFLPSVAGLAGQ